MDKLIDSAAIAAIMAMQDELQEMEKAEAVNAEHGNSERDLPVNIEITDKDPSNGYLRLCNMAESLFNAADAACGTVTELSASEIIPAMLCDIFYEAIRAAVSPVEKKIAVYEHAIQYCSIPMDFTGEMLFNTGDNLLAGLIGQLTNMGFSVILTASHKSGRYADGTGFIAVFAELVNYAEESVYNKYKAFKFNQKPALIVIEKAQVILEEQMHTMEADDPTLKDDSLQEETNSDKVNTALNAARNLMKTGNMGRATQKYREALVIDPKNWEATFFSEFCSVAVTSPSMVCPENITYETQKIIRAAEIAIPLSKSQIYTRIDMLNSLSNITQLVIKQATHWYVATMNAYKSSSNNARAESEKVQRINSIIRMVFTIGDVIEQHYSDDRDICAATAYGCWSIGITCYESTNMPQPPGAYEHWMKMKKYDPTCHCDKTISPNENDGYTTSRNTSTGDSSIHRISSENTSSRSGENQTSFTNSNTSRSGCYIATCVYGSYDCPPVWTLRRFRDMRLAKTTLGRVFIRFYYFLSPKMVLLFGRTRWFHNGFKYFLDRFVNKLQKDGVEASPYKDAS